MKKLSVLCLLACLALPVKAFAFDYSGVYVTPKFIMGIQHGDLGSDTTGTVPGLVNDSYTNFNLGGGLAIGYDWYPNCLVPVRLEVEYSLFGRDASHRNRSPIAGTHYRVNTTTKTQLQSVFANVYYDFHNDTRITPYIGAGIGWGIVGTRGKITVDDNGTLTSYSAGSKSDSNLAWNVGVGASVDVTERMKLDLGYRYAGFGDGQSETVTVAGPGGTTGTARLKSDNNGMHQFMVGARFTF